jgi:aspartate/methionine/tyrosine aminotransferase
VGFQVSVPQGAYYVFTKYRGVPALAKLEPMAAAMFLIQMIGVAPVPGSGFYGEGDDGAEYIRFTFCRSAPATLSA